MLWREVLFIFLHAISCVEVISELYYLLQERCYGTGIRVFLGDRVLVFNPATGVEEEKGLADLKNGVDIKTLTMLQQLSSTTLIIMVLQMMKLFSGFDVVRDLKEGKSISFRKEAL